MMILYQDEHWLVVDKPAGMATHAPRAGELGAVEWLELHLGLKTHVVSRLDRETSGVLLLARDAAASARAQRIHEQGGARKVYEFLSDRDAGAVGLPAEWVRDDEIDGKSARTEFRRLGAVGRYWSYRVEIARGRAHQIRRHAAASGVPILGDGEHGGTAWPRLCLHCAEVRWPEIAEPVRAGRPASFGAAAAPDIERDFAICRDRRGDWIAAVSDAWRVVHRGEIAGLPASVDVYGSWFDAVWYDEGGAARETAVILEPLLTRVAEAYGCRGGTVRVHRRNPHGSALVADLVVAGEPPPDRFTVTEHGLRYEVSLTKTQHTGLFLDQRDTRRRVAAIAAGQRCANLFAYTCSFSVVVAAAGAEVVFSVDTAKPCLTTGRRNFELNGLAEAGRGKFIQEDVRQWLERQRRKKESGPGSYRPLDLVICDPPVFASAKDGGGFVLEKEWPVLARGAADLLADDGCAVFANNHQGGDHDLYRRQLEDEFAEVVDLQAPLDFSPVVGRAQYVRTFWCK
ncbi:MAG: class I SAM-dependent methyltransferase [bacterium]|nr:class I SAM-dependent methyltransferase [bacterium]